MNVLVHLASNPGAVVSKEELMEAVWGGAFVEEGALSQAIHSLRKVLGDDARQPRFIQTIPKRGYRLVAPVTSGEATGEGEADSAPPQPESSSRRAVVKRRTIIVLLWCLLGLVSTIAFWSAWKHVMSKSAPFEGQAIRIVVLPFENLGKPADAFFADGLTEEITKDLASFPALRVISRTSAAQYKGAKKSLPEIGRELGVDYVLEGTVLWDYGTVGQPRIRITPQLIRVGDDTHIWAEAFERRVGDIFEVQAEISRKVIEPLGIALMPRESLSFRHPHTENIEAYRAYLRGLELENQPFYDQKHVEMAVSMFERAVALDTRFVEAWAELSKAHSYIEFNSDESPSRIEKARQSLDKAVALAPDALEVGLAQAYFDYRCLRNIDLAKKELTILAETSPNNAEIIQTIGFVLRRKGQLRIALGFLQRGFDLDPRTVKLVWAIAETYRALRDFEQADHYYAQAVSLAPDQSFFWEEKTLNRLAWTGDLNKARAVLKDATLPEAFGLTPVTFQLDFYARNYKRAIGRLSSERMQDLTLVDQSRLSTLAAIARERLGDHQGALAAADANRAVLEALVARFPEGAFLRAYLAVALAQLGREREALLQIEKAIYDERLDAFSGPRMVQVQAIVYVILNHRQEAIGRLAWLLSIPYKSSICPSELRLDPIWDPLRADPEFGKLLNGPQGLTG